MPPRKQWDPERMKAAIEALTNKEMVNFKTSRTFCVPKKQRWSGMQK